MKIRLAEQEDIVEIVRFDHIARMRSRKDRREFIKTSVLNKRCYVATARAKPIGYTVLEYDFWGFGGGFISILYIKDSFRRNGIGSALMKYAENKCTKAKLFTSTNQSNKPMPRLLKKLGYERSGIIYNLDPDDPELIYFKYLGGKASSR